MVPSTDSCARRQPGRITQRQKGPLTQCRAQALACPSHALSIIGSGDRTGGSFGGLGDARVQLYRPLRAPGPYFCLNEGRAAPAVGPRGCGSLLKVV